MTTKPTHPLTEKVTIRCSRQQKAQIREILRRNPTTKEAELLRYLLDAVLETAERRGLAGLMALREASRRASPASVDLPLFTGRLPEPSLRLSEGDGQPIPPEDADGVATAPRGQYPAHAIAFTVPNDDVSAAGIHQGMLVALDLSATPRDGDLVVAERGQSILLRRLRRKGRALTLLVEHPEYEETWTPKSETVIRGVVLGTIAE